MKNCIPPGCIQKGKGKTSSCIIEQNKEEGTFTVLLTKTKNDKSFGLTIAGGVDKGSTPFISSIKVGGLAERYGYFSINDEILEVNNTSILRLDHAQIIKIIQEHGNKLKLKARFNTHQKDWCEWKKSSVLLRREKSHGFGITIAGGTSVDGELQRPVVITDVNFYSITGKMGVLFPGDHIEKINNRYVDKLEHHSVDEIFAASDNELILHYMYPISPVCQKRQFNTYTVVEIHRPHEECPLGININVSFEYGSYGSNFIISNLIEGSLAARTELLHIGDLVISINSTTLDGMSLFEANKMLTHAPKLTYLQVLRTDTNIQCCCSSSSANTPCNISNLPIEIGSDSERRTCSHVNTLENIGHWDTTAPVNNSLSITTKAHINNEREQLLPFPMLAPSHYGNSRSLQSSIYSGRLMFPVTPKLPSGGSICSFMSHGHKFITKSTSSKHETFTVQFDNHLLPFEVQDDITYYNRKCLIVVDVVSSKSMDLCNMLQIGDRILSINDMSTEDVFASELVSVLQDVSLPLVMNVEFDISDAVQPNKGSFSIKIYKNNADVGISVANSSPTDQEVYVRILNIKKGSPAYRLGVLSPGDQIISINGECARHTAPDDIHRMLSKSNDPVEMIIKKDEEITGPTFSVEMAKNGEQLGICISGSEYPFQPILISDISEDGLAFRSKAIHIGDNILAINDISLRGKTGNEACEILRNTGEKVKFLIKREAYINKSEAKYQKPQVRTSHGFEPMQEVCRAFSSSLDKSSTFDTTDTYSDSSDAKNESARLHGITKNSTETKQRHISSKDLYTTSPVNLTLSSHLDVCHVLVRANQKKEINLLSATDSSAVDVSSHDSLDPASSREGDDADFDRCRQALSGLSTTDQEVSAITFRVNRKKSRLKRSLKYRKAPFCNTKSIRKFIDHSQGEDDGDDSPLLFQPFHVDSNNTKQCVETSTTDRCKISDTSQAGSVEPLFQIEKFRLPSLHKVSSINNILSMRTDDQVLEEETDSSYPTNVYNVQLFRSVSSEGYGFSVSDGVAENGVFVRSIQAGSIADRCGNLLKYDRIVQVNGCDTRNMSCDTVVPLLQASHEKLELLVERYTNL